MEIIKIEDLSFTYPGRNTKALENISISAKPGEFITLCGKSGCGKTTLLRLMKSALTPYGEAEGSIFFEGKPLAEIEAGIQAAKIGFVMQSPDNQIVTDKVWHELAFGLESLGYSTPEIRTRVSEMASFFGIQSWFYKNVAELSGGQKQLLNLASVMVMQPSVLILDEPTSQLDPIAAAEFLKTLEKINRELGTTVILSEHRLEEAFPISDRVIVMDEGKIIADGNPRRVGDILKSENHDMYLALPSPMKVYGSVESSLICPVTVREGRVWLEEHIRSGSVKHHVIPADSKDSFNGGVSVEIKDAWFRYEKELPDVIKGLNIKVRKGELFAIVGGNGTGKTTALSLISGLHTPYRGEVLINGESIVKCKNLYNGVLGVLPQNPQSVFVKKTVYFDLVSVLSETKLSKGEKDERVRNMARLCRIEELLQSHPYDLSGGEQQRAALAKVLLTSPGILLLDEPTKGLDAHFKQIFAEIINDLKSKGVTVIMVSHDIEFCAEFADRCAMFFDGTVTSEGTPREFFRGKNFYTTSASRMARTTLPEAVLPDDIILAIGGKIRERVISKTDVTYEKINQSEEKVKKELPKITPARVITGIVFSVLFILTTLIYLINNDIPAVVRIEFAGLELIQIIAIVEVITAFICLFPGRELGAEYDRLPEADRKLAKRTVVAAMLILLAIPLTIYVGIFFLGDRKYYFISLLIIIETVIPFCMVFESRKPKARELVTVSVLCAIGVAGRGAFFMLPQFKPVIALVIIVGVCFGGETGFLVGAVTGFVSNFLFGQGPWTPWQMFAFGIIGFIAGVLFKKGFLRRTKSSLCIYGFAATLIIYGGIMDPASIIMWQGNVTGDMILSAYAAGLPFNLIHSVSTAFFLWFIAETMIEKLERIKIKYGLIEALK